MLVLRRFFEKLSVGPDCWEWIGARIPEGYGQLSVDGRVVGAHRLAWELAHGASIPPRLLVRHRCDNPKCVRPSHLALGTVRDNARDSVERGRNKEVRKTHCQRGHSYSGRNLYVSPRGDRQCRSCKARYERERYLR